MVHPLLRNFMLLLIAIVPLKLCGQLAIGAAGGYTRNYYYSNMAQSFLNKKQLPGYCTGIIVQYAHSRLFTIQSGVELVQKDYSLQRTGVYTGIYQSFTNTYIQVPLMAQFQTGGRKIRCYLKPGIYGAWWMAARTKGVIPNLLNYYTGVNNNGSTTDYFILTPYNGKYTFQPDKDRRFEFGWLAGAGIVYHLSNRVSLFTEGRYYYSLTDQQKDHTTDHTAAYNQTMVICAGALFVLPNKKPAIR
jgi:hypothetical protein